MKKIVPIVLLAMMISCSSNDKMDKEQKLNEYKTELTRLKKEISKLEKEMADESGQGVVKVNVKPVGITKFRHYVDVTGNVNADKNILVSPEVMGNLISISVREGDHVKKGQILGRLNTEMIERSIREVRINHDLAVTTFKRRKNLWDQNIGSEMEYLQAKSNKEALEQKLEALKAQLALSVIKSPINGVIDEVILRVGEMATPQQPFARIVNIDNVYITADVSEMYLPKIHRGDEVDIEFPVLNKTIKKSIFRISSVIDPSSRTFRVRVNLKNDDNMIKPNMMAVLKLLTYSDDNAIVVPSILVKKDFTGDFIFIAEKDGDRWVARKRYVETGIKNNNKTVVTDGLSGEDRIIVKGYAQVVDGSEIEQPLPNPPQGGGE